MGYTRRNTLNIIGVVSKDVTICQLILIIHRSIFHKTHPFYILVNVKVTGKYGQTLFVDTVLTYCSLSTSLEQGNINKSEITSGNPLVIGVFANSRHQSVVIGLCYITEAKCLRVYLHDHCKYIIINFRNQVALDKDYIFGKI